MYQAITLVQTKGYDVMTIMNSLAGAGRGVVNTIGGAAQGINSVKSSADRNAALVSNTGSTDSIDATRSSISKGDAKSAELDGIANEENGLLRETSMLAAFEDKKEALSNQILASKSRNSVVQF
ncbi:Type III secretion system helper protein HrpA2 [Pseudomonas syringae pv. solidagae]|uniref:Type III secretion system helper protein HrpA2 n=2 Tax=Pseudomonas syringae TaxID=317 RepID=A0A0P9Z675_PSESX|nr:Type III secretion system helper protein HrpA2 [Pseudomonas syringae pv. solidagae]RMT32925.1 Type III secretion system helper protein HrpA2 [Pseudomonas syringae pv. solidagae]RMT39635.1 Type III secretion system helper protein HrpA2 [Pseudomonas syringae pv. solidagae]